MNGRQESGISRREFLKSSGVAAGAGAAMALGLTSPVSGAGESSPKRPNILYIFTDQQFAEAMSCAGCKDVKTPAMDSIAASGARFSRAYCTMPLCSPARASMWTGMMPHEDGVDRNGAEILEQLRSREIAALLARAGYDCQYAGKWHIPGYTLQKGHGFELLSRDGDQIVEKACVDYLGKRKPGDKPFFLVASFHNPHDICAYPSGRPLSKMGNGAVPDAPSSKWPALPDNFGIPLWEPPIVQEYHASNNRWTLTRGWNADKWRHYRYAYYRMCEIVDARVGSILDALRKQGLEEDTVVIFSSDHGDGMAAHGWNQKWVFYDESSRVPFIVSYKGRTRAGHVDSSHLVSVGPDLFATICDYAGVDSPEGVRGRSVRAIAEGKEVADWRDQVICQTWMLYPGPLGRMVRTSRFKYTCWSDSPKDEREHREMLVDLLKDPGEMFNLLENPMCKNIVADHRRRLAAWCEDAGDKFNYVK